MPGTTTTWLVLVAFGLLVVILLAAWRLSVGQQIEEAEPPTYEQELEGLKPEAGEQVASAASEHIEFEVRKRLAGHPDLAEVALDFGTQEDGSLAIWVDDRKYTDVESIPDSRIRQAVREAVQDFNE